MNSKTSFFSLPFYKASLYLSVEAMEYLSKTTDGTSHFAIFNQLIKTTVVHPTTTSKRGNNIPLKRGQTECSINSFSQMMGMGRKSMERIFRDFEQLGIIRLQRSRLATVADVPCIISWQLNDDSVIYNDIPLVKADSQNGNVFQRETVPTENIRDSKADVSEDVKSKSPADTSPSTSPASFVSPLSDNPVVFSTAGDQGAGTVPSPSTPSDNANITPFPSKNSGTPNGYPQDLFEGLEENEETF